MCVLSIWNLQSFFYAYKLKIPKTMYQQSIHTSRRCFLKSDGLRTKNQFSVLSFLFVSVLNALSATQTIAIDMIVVLLLSTDTLYMILFVLYYALNEHCTRLY